jgi:hypothetical protein
MIVKALSISHEIFSKQVFSKIMKETRIPKNGKKYSE